MLPPGEQRRDRKDGPVHGHALDQGPDLRLAPDPVEPGVDRIEQNDGRDRQRNGAQRRQFPRVAQKQIELAAHGLDILGQEDFEDERQQVGADPVEHRESRQYGKSYGGERHDRQQCGVAERGRRTEIPVFPEAPAQIDAKFGRRANDPPSGGALPVLAGVLDAVFCCCHARFGSFSHGPDIRQGARHPRRPIARTGCEP